MPPPVGLGVDRRRRTRQGTRGLARTLLRFAVASAAELVNLPSVPLRSKQRQEISSQAAQRKDDRRRYDERETHHGFAPDDQVKPPFAYMQRV